jgi:hypothetical protein
MNVQRATHLLALVIGLVVLGCACEEAPSGGGGEGGAPCEAVTAAAERVSVANDLGTLEGTLLLPASACGPVPVVLIVSGSGSSDRDGGAPEMYRLLAEALAGEGIGSLRYDDHGIGGSASAAPDRVEDFRFDLEIADAARFIGWLRRDARVGAIALAGHSQGSLTAILAGAAEPFDGFVSLAGAGRPIGRLLHDQLADQLTPEQLAALDDAIATLERGELAGPLEPPLDQILPLAVQPYLISWVKYDPKVEIASVAAPALIIQGEVDVQVAVLDAQLLHEGLPSAELLLIGDMCHVLKQADATTASQRAAYEDPAVPLAPALVPAIAAFVTGLR